MLGWTVDDHEWEQVLRVALHETYVVQEAVSGAAGTVAAGARRLHIEMVDMAVDMDPYLFGGSWAERSSAWRRPLY